MGLLEHYGYAYENICGTEFRFEIRTVEGPWRTQVQVFERERTVRIFIFLTDSGYPPERITFVRELVERLNTVVVFGRFAFDQGAVTFHYAFDAFGRSRSPKTLERALKSAALPLALWNHAIGFLHKPKVSAAMAMDFALWSEDAKEVEGLRSDTLRSILEVRSSRSANPEGTEMPSPKLTIVK